MGKRSWLLCLIFLPGVSWWLSGSSSRCHEVVCSLWLWYFLIILTYFFCQFFLSQFVSIYMYNVHGEFLVNATPRTGFSAFFETLHVCFLHSMRMELWFGHYRQIQFSQDLPLVNFAIFGVAALYLYTYWGPCEHTNSSYSFYRFFWRFACLFDLFTWFIFIQLFLLFFLHFNLSLIGITLKLCRWYLI